MELIIAEKPNAAAKIAKALGTPEMKRLGRINYYRVENKGKEYCVVSAVGHIFTLAEKKKSITYPTFDIEWKPSYAVSKASAYTKDYANVIASLAKEAKRAIIACDYDIEGTLIGYNVARFILNNEKNLERMKFSTLTPNELREAFEKRTEFDINNAYAGEARHIIDWYYGINLSRALMGAIKKTGMFRIMSIGRVQGPTLGIASEKEIEIGKFIPVPFWAISILLKDVEFEYSGGRIFEKEKAGEIFSRIGDDATIKEVSKDPKKLMPPVPFDLTSLQVEAYAQFRFSPAKTLQLSQSLYENSLISYPRTSSQKLPPALGLKNVIMDISKHNGWYAKGAQYLIENKRFMPNEGKKEDAAHPAIYPTGIEPKSIGDSERKLYELIVARFLSVFAEPALEEITKVVADSNKIEFRASGKVIKEKGWIEIYGKFFKSKDIILPEFRKGEKLKIEKKNLKNDMTKPPKRYTEASLVSELESRHLGTKATRAVVVSTMFDRQYFAKESNAIDVTVFGLAVYQALKENAPHIIDENMTRDLEDDMELIQFGKKDKEEVIKKGKDYLVSILDEFKNNEAQIGKSLIDALKKMENETSILGNCKCGGKLKIINYKGSKFVGCTGYPNCRQSYSLPRGVMIRPTDKICEKCGVPMIDIRKGGRGWLTICLDPACPTRQEWKNRKESEKEKEEPEEESTIATDEQEE
ncbi:MAG: DNA topoisomerase I [Candidatus Micrarchaeota archaeon]|nr:DNA topoisomerase I [Candidatus Micrarchaeota archaeon]